MDNTEEGLSSFLKLNRETNTRQKFYTRPDWHFQEMKKLFNQPQTHDPKQLIMHLLTAKYNGKTLVAWIIFIFKDTLYYPYGASSSENREVMASNLMMWETIKIGKQLGLKKFDMWGALGPNPNQKDPWFGFHNFKERYGPEHIEFVGSYDVIVKPKMYQVYKITNKLRWLYLKLKK
jgi:lipid II:glycine glycyltransferase (peptidoglycan interpeptide bridge formation enzyme)